MGASVSSSLKKSRLAREQEHGECEASEIVLRSKDRHMRLIKLTASAADNEEEIQRCTPVVSFKGLLCNAAASEKCFCLFEDDNEEMALKNFRILREVLPRFYVHFSEVYCHDVLQSLVFCTLQNPQWTALDVAKHLELASYLSHSGFMSATQEDAEAKPPNKDPASQVLMESETSLDMAKQLIQGIAINFINEKQPDVIPFFEQSLSSAGQMGDKFRKGVEVVQEYSNSPVHLAVRVGNSGLLSDLLVRGSSDSLLCGHVFPIHLAVKCEQLPCVQILLLHNKDNVHTKDGKYRGSPLHWAKSYKAIDLLLSHGADVNAQNAFNETPLHVMTKRKRLSCIVFLVSCGADVNARGIHGKIPLHYAVQMNELLLVKALLVFGSDQHIQDDEGCSAKALAYRGGVDFKEVQEALLVYDKEKTKEKMYASTPEPGKKYSGPSYMKRKMGKEAVLCLDGGGIRGLILLEILMVLADECNAQLQGAFDWVSGTSTGSYLAVLLAQGASLRDIHCRYFRLKQKVFAGRKPYSSETFESLLVENFGEKSTMDEILYPRVIIPAVAADRRPAELHLIRSYDAPYAYGPRTLDNETFHSLRKPADEVIWKAIRYSASAPSYFRPLLPYLDGGFIANNPTLDVLTEIHEYHKYTSGKSTPSNAPVNPLDCIKSAPSKDRTMSNIGIVISLGTGKSPVEPVQVVDLFAPQSFYDAQQVLLGVRSLGELLIDQSTCTDGHMVERAKNWCESAGVQYFRFNPPMTSDWQLDEQDDAEIISMLFDTRKYIRHNIVAIREAANLLMGRR